jgi:hypothetical protein
MKKLIVVLALLATACTSASAQAGIFGRRRPQSTAQSQTRAQSQTTNRSNSYQPARSNNPFPFNSRSDPRDWNEAHRGYGIKIRGW